MCHGPCRHRHEIEPESRRVSPRPDRQPRRGCRPRHPRLPRARDRDRRRLLDRRPRLPPRPARRPRRPHRPAAGGAELPEHRVARRGGRRRPAATRSTPAGASSPRTPTSPAPCEDNDLVFVGPTPESIETMGDKVTRQGDDGGRGRAGRSRARTARPARRGAGARRARSGSRCSSRRRPAAAARACASSTTAEELEPAFRMAVRGGRGGFADGVALRREGDRGRAPRRDPGARRRRGRRAHARRARLLDPATAPEADRGGAVARRHARPPRRDGGRSGAGLRVAALPRRRDARVPGRRRASSTSSR